MRRLTIVVLTLVVAVAPSFAKTHKDNYSVPCSVLWPAVKDTLRNSGKYGILGIDSNEMTASFVIGGTLGGKRINSVVLNAAGSGCELQVQTAFSGLAHDDAGDFKKRVDASLAKQQAAGPAPKAEPAAEKKTEATPETKSETKPDAKSEEKPEAKPETKPQGENR